MSLPSGTAAQFDEEMTAMQRQASRRMTTKEKRAAEAALKRKEEVFKKLLGLCSYEAKVMRGEIQEVLDYGGVEFNKVKEKVDSTSWNWLSRNGSNGLADCSREQILSYKSAFSPDQWEGMMKTWEIVEDRARTVEKKLLSPLEGQLKSSEKRMKRTIELAKLCDELLENYDSIFDDMEHIEVEAKAFMSRYNNLDDTSKSYKKHVLLDDCTLLRELRDLLHGNDDSTKASGAEDQSLASLT
mmetsp:Transcript_12081/g.24686  ORF Transcript_12081/g.24686 Transcript_12081/m.24686 type:complete len:242 (-) Transcript_12081:23-748(-)